MKKVLRGICLALAILLLAAPVLSLDAYGAGYTIKGMVTTSGSESDTIEVELLQNGAVISEISVAAKKATYQFTSIAPGTYTLRVSKVGHETYTGTVTVSNADVTRDVTLVSNVVATYTLSGTISSSGSSSDAIKVELYQGNTLVKSASVKGNSAQYSLTEIVAGSYTLKVSKPGHMTHQSTVSIEDNNVVKNISLSKTPTITYTISGTVSSYGDANAPISLELYSGTTLLKSLTLYGNSVKYSLSGIPAGTYRLVVKKEGHNDYISDVVVNNANTSKNVPMFKILGSSTVTVSGKISGMAGTGSVRIYLYVKGKELPAYETMRSGNGNYTISGVEPGTYTIKAVAPGHDDYSATVILNGDTTHNITMKGQHTCTQDRWFSDGTHHWLACAECGKEVSTSRGTHMGGEATCVSKAKCGVCDAVYGEFAPHNWSETWGHSTAAGHSHTCMTAGCEALSDPEAHTPNIPAATQTEDQVCTACGYVMAKASVPANPTDPSDPTDTSDPTDPTDPTDPAEPTDPADPTEPTAPISDGEKEPEDLSVWMIVLIAVAAAGIGVVITVLIMKKKK